MKKTLIIFTLLAVVVFACQQTEKQINAFLTPSRLTPQLVTVDITKDTTLLTRKGAVIKIPKGALDAGGSTTITLEIKEAYTMRDILQAGLTTLSNGQPLSSGGMIYINPVGGNAVRIVKPISIASPTPYIDPGMKLYKGEVNSDSTINWTNPQPLPANPQQAKLEYGKKMFLDNCASCHRIEKDLTGPALAHAVKRLSKDVAQVDSGKINMLYAFTRNNSKILASGDPYYCALFNQWNKTAMNVFPALTDEDLNNLYGYIQNESDRLHLPVPDNGIMRGLDSCKIYMAATKDLRALKKRLEADSVALVNDIRDFPVDTTNTADTLTDTLPEPPLLDFIDPLGSKSLYYQFTIESFGWYNIDILMKNIGAVESTLTVHMQGIEKTSFSLYLAIPSIKGLFPAGPLTDQKDTYGFFTKDGGIPLPQNTQAWLFAVGEQGDSMLFAGKGFTTATSQKFDLQLSVITKEAFQREMANMNLQDLKITVGDTKNADTLRKVIRELKKSETLKPKNCDCECVMPGGASPVAEGITEVK